MTVLRDSGKELDRKEREEEGGRGMQTVEKFCDRLSLVCLHHGVKARSREHREERRSEGAEERRRGGKTKFKETEKEMKEEGGCRPWRSFVIVSCVL